MSFKVTPQALPTTSASSGSVSLERLARQKGKSPEQELVRLRKAAKEFEAFFTYQMLKTMRQTTLSAESKGGPLSDGLGKGVFTDMFDMELSRSMPSNNPRSLAAILSKSLEKRVAAQFTDPTVNPTQLHDLKGNTQPGGFPLKDRALPLTSEPMPLSLPRDVARVSTVLPARMSLQPQAHLHESKSESTPVMRTVESVKKPVSEIRQRFGSLIDDAAERHGLDSALIEAVIATESSGNPLAVSPAGAKGLMQLMPGTAKDMQVSDPLVPAANINGGAKYLARMLDRFGSLPLALAAYNAGPSRVARHGGIPLIAEIEKYVAKVLSRYETVRRSDVATTPKAPPATDR